jgi:hypothetical protein
MVTAAEKKTLAWLAARMPVWVGFDHLTIPGFAGQLMVGTSYALSRHHARWLLWGVLFLAVNWFGDSLDGTLARFRNRQRPRYGFYVDHVVDAIGSTVLVTGLAFSGLASLYLFADPGRTWQEMRSCSRCWTGMRHRHDGPHVVYATVKQMIQLCREQRVP